MNYDPLDIQLCKVPAGITPLGETMRLIATLNIRLKLKPVLFQKQL